MGVECPYALALLPLSALPLLAFLMRRRGAVAFPGAAGLRAAGSLRVRLLPLLPVVQAAGLALVVFAAAGPYAASRAVRVEEDTRAIILAIDTSESMRALDMSRHQRGSVTRLEVALESCAAFIRRREGDRIGLIAFGGRAVTQCPLTADHDLALWLLGEIRVEMLGKRTAIGDAIALAAGRIGEGGGAVVLLSDGANTAGRAGPAQAARAARSRGVTVHTIAVGAGGHAAVRVRLPSGRTVLRTKRYPLDERTLREVAELSGGIYFRAPGSGELAGVLEEIDRLEPRPAVEVKRLPLGRWGWILALAGVLLAGMAQALSCTLLRSAPRLA